MLDQLAKSFANQGAALIYEVEGYPALIKKRNVGPLSKVDEKALINDDPKVLGSRREDTKELFDQKSTKLSLSKAGKAALSEEEQAQVEKLKTRDREVRAHEAAHLAAAGGLAKGGATYEYQSGPDGQRYAVGGEVSINTSPGKTPEETLRRAQQIASAASAPAEPSGQDRAVAAQAAQMAADARAQLLKQESDKKSENNSEGKSIAIAQYSRQSQSKETGFAPKFDMVA